MIFPQIIRQKLLKGVGKVRSSPLFQNPFLLISPISHFLFPQIPPPPFYSPVLFLFSPLSSHIFNYFHRFFNHFPYTVFLSPLFHDFQNRFSQLSQPFFIAYLCDLFDFFTNPQTLLLLLPLYFSFLILFLQFCFFPSSIFWNSFHFIQSAVSRATCSFMEIEQISSNLQPEKIFRLIPPHCFCYTHTLSFLFQNF